MDILPLPAERDLADRALPLDNPALGHLRVRLLEWEAGSCVFGLTIAPEHLNRQSSLQGGIAAALLDAACGYAGLIERPGAEAGNAATVMLTISYLDRASEGDVYARGRVTRSGRSLYFSAGELVAEDGRVLATAQGSFKRDRRTGDGTAENKNSVG